MLLKQPLEVSQIINDVNSNQRHVHADGITIVWLHPKCKILPTILISIITISCLMFLVNAEILVLRMQIRGERSGWKAVRLKAEMPRFAITKNYLWDRCQTRRITDIRVTPARECIVSVNTAEDATFMPLATSYPDTHIELICKTNSQLNIQGILYKNREMSVARSSPYPCMRRSVTEAERTRISECLGRSWIYTLSESPKRRDDKNFLWCLNANVSAASITRALRENAYFRPLCTELEVQWIWWDGQTTWTLLSAETGFLVRY